MKQVFAPIVAVYPTPIFHDFELELQTDQI